MNVTSKSDELNNFELISPEEFISRLDIGMSTLHLWKSKGLLVPGRHYIKIGNVVRYFWSVDRLVEIHEISNRELKMKNEQQAAQTSWQKQSGERVNWDY